MIEKLSKTGLISMVDEILAEVDGLQREGVRDRTAWGLEQSIDSLAGNVLALGLVVKEILKRSEIK